MPSQNQYTLEGKRVLIVGGVGGGLGRAITRAVSAAGAKVIVVAGRNLSRAKEAAEEVTNEETLGIALAADVRDEAAIVRLVAKGVEAAGGLDVLITVVGGYTAYARYQPLHFTSDESWDLIFDVNVRYVFRLLRELIPVFLAQDSGGAIVSVGSLGGTMGMPMCPAYGAAKAALMNLAQSVTAEYGRQGIRMNVINIGTVATPGLDRLINDGLRFEQIPMGSPGTAEDAAEFAVFLASSHANYIGGQSINFDGGASARCRFHLPGTDSSMACHCDVPS